MPLATFWFASPFKEWIGQRSLTIAWEGRITLGEVWERLAAEYPALRANLLRRGLQEEAMSDLVAVIVDGDILPLEAEIKDGAKVDVLTPLSGGTGSQSPECRLPGEGSGETPVCGSCSRLRIGAHAQIWVAPFTGGTLDLVGHVRDLGFDAIDINVGELPPPFPAVELRRRLSEAGLEASLGAFLNVARDITSENPDVRRTGIEFLLGVARLCGEVGAKTFIGPMHSEIRRQRADLPAVREERWKRCVEGLAAVAREAERVGVRVAVEILNRYESDFLTTTADGVRLCQAVGNPRLGLLLDTFHMNLEEKWLGDAIRSAAGHVHHIHTCENDRGAPGSGHLNWVEVRDALRDIGYDGICTIESYNPDLPTLVERTSFWRPVAPSQDDLAREGLAFLRRLFEAAE